MTDLFAKAPPTSKEAEQSVLGCILLDNNAIDCITEIINESDFYREGHRRVYSHMLDLREHNSPVDILTVVESLRQADDLERAGGTAYIAGLADIVPAAAHAKSYARIVRDKAQLRRLITTAQGMAARAYENVQDVPEMIEECKAALNEIDGPLIETTAISFNDMMLSGLDQLAYNIEHGIQPGLSSAHDAFNDMTGGYYPGEMAILAADPGTGKTAYAIQDLLHISRTTPSALFSLETPHQPIAQRIMALISGANLRDIRFADITSDGFDAIYKQVTGLGPRELWVDTSVTTVQELILRAKRMIRENGVGFIVVDYLQKLKFGGNKEGKVIDVSEVTTALSNFARLANIHMLCLAQPNQDKKQRPNKWPQNGDLGWSSQAYQDARCIMWLHKHEPKAADNDPAGLYLVVTKQNNGEPGLKRRIDFNGPTQRFDLWRDM